MSDMSGKFEVGYGKPPKEHRFQKGKSGNPKGRTKGSKNAKPVSLEFGMQPAAEFLRKEAYRPVTIREGDKVIELPAIQAVFRAMGVSAMKGNRFAQKTMAELVKTMEEQDFKLRMDHFGTAVEYKHTWGQEIERCRAAGIPEPEPIPHPDDMILNPENGGVRILGPKTKEQKDEYERSILRRDEAQAEVSYFAEKYRRARDPKMKELWLKEWLFEQKIFDTINDLIGKRYQVDLKDRSYHSGATRRGDIARKYGFEQ